MEAELPYSIMSLHRTIADYTGVPDALRGTGAGRELVKRLVSAAPAEDVRILALCPFVRAHAKRHPEWADVFT